jgi:TRAP transporter 4TM/12TM fusion protein
MDCFAMPETPRSGTLRWANLGLTGAAIALAAYHYWTSYRGALPFIRHRSVHLGGVYIILLLSWLQPRGEDDDVKRRVPLVAALIFLSSAFFILSFTRDIAFIRRQDPASLAYVLWGVGVLLLGLELCRRVLGWMLSGIVIGLATIVLLAHFDFIPWSRSMASVTTSDMSNTAIFTTQGIFGSITGISAGVVASFLIFGGMLSASGGSDSLMDLAKILVGRFRGGPGKISVVTSAFFGTVSGSAVANVVVDGVFNIPLMKRTGFKPEFAAAVEATTSAGGQLVPPVMGAAAFIMAEFTNIPYRDIVIAAVVPVLLYYLALFVSIHIQAVKQDLSGIPKAELPPFSRLYNLNFIGSFVVPMTILLMVIYVWNRSLTFASWTATTSIILFVLIRPDRPFLQRLLIICEGARTAGMEIAKIGAIVIAAQLLVSILGMSAIASRLANFLAMGSLPVSLGLVFLAVVVVILGFGVPTAAAYVIAASFSTPIFRSLGIDPLPGHLFILYFTVYANVTPPVMPATYAAAAIAKANAAQAGLIGMRLLCPALLVPFIFVTHPEILLNQGSLRDTAILFIFAAAGLSMVAMGLGGWFGRILKRREQPVVAAIGVLIAWPTALTTMAGCILLAALVFCNWKKLRLTERSNDSVEWSTKAS